MNWKPNCNQIFRSNRNISDDQIKLLAAGGGVIGVTTFPGIVSHRPQPSKDDLLAHFDHYASLVGIDHIGFGSDYFNGQAPYAS